MSKSIEQSIKQKLKNISKESNIPVNFLLNTLFLERFLARISHSVYRDKLIFKGGLCLSQLIKLGRETRDIDLLMIQLNGNIKTVRKLMQEISSADIGDGFVFSQIEINMHTLEHKKHPGYRISVQGQLGQIKNKVFIDIGIGDVVRPRVLELELIKMKVPLFKKTISLNSYPPEYIFSEKVESILHLSQINSRMKDFYDCYRLIDEKVLDEKTLKTALHETTQNRETKLEQISENTEIFDIKWKRFLQKNNLGDLNLKDAISKINEAIKKSL